MDECHICGSSAVGKGMVEGTKVPLCMRCARYAGRFEPFREYLPPKAEAKKVPKAEETLVQGFGKAIRDAREKKGFTTEEFAKKYFIKEGDLVAFESERLKPVEKVARKIEYALGIKLLAQEPSLEAAVKEARAQKKGNEVTLGDMIEIKKK